MIYILIVIGIVLMEYKIKNYIEANFEQGEEKKILNGKITVTKYYNKGAFLNLLENKKEIVKTVSLAGIGILLLLFAFALPKKGNRLYKLGFALLLGGGISNVSDRLMRGHVVDYFSINAKKIKNIVFNLADIAIFIGAILIFLSSLFTTVFQSGTDKTTE